MSRKRPYFTKPRRSPSNYDGSLTALRGKGLCLVIAKADTIDIAEGRGLTKAEALLLAKLLTNWAETGSPTVPEETT